MKMTMTDGTVFEGSMAEYAELVAFAERKAAEQLDMNVEKPIDTITFEGEEYRKVDRKAQAGDVFIITHDNGDLPEWFTVGKMYKAYESEGDLMVIADDSDDLSVYTDRFGRTTETIDVYEPIVKAQSKPKLKAGDFVKFTKRGDYNSADITLNKPYLVSEDSYGDLTFKDDADDYREEPLEYTDCYEIISAEDMAEYQQALASRNEEVKWAKIGRKVGEFKVGDIAKVINSPSALPNGTLFTVKRVSGSDVFDDSKAGYVYMVPEVQLELIAPVDARFDKER